LGPKLKGLSPTLIDRIRDKGIADIILVEADGAKRCPLKAPNETEPVIPFSTTWTLPIVGLDRWRPVETQYFPVSQDMRIRQDVDLPLDQPFSCRGIAGKVAADTR